MSLSLTTSRPMLRLLLIDAVHAICWLCAATAAGQSLADVSRQQLPQPGSSSVGEQPGTASPRSDLLIGKFEILATYTYAKALRDGLPEPEAKQRGIMAAVIGTRARGVSRGSHELQRRPDTAASCLIQQADSHRRDLRRAGRQQAATVLRIGIRAHDETIGRRPPYL